MTANSLNSLLLRLPSLRIGVLGDFCLDAYWTLDASGAELSLETGLPVRRVREQRYALGGAGTIVNNLTAMGVGTVRVFGLAGDDPFGNAMRRLLGEQGVDSAGLLRQAADWNTPVYGKPILEDQEQSRIDFGSFNRLSDETAGVLLKGLEAGLPDLDAVIVNQQLLHGLHTTFFRAELNGVMARHPHRLFVLDSRHFPEGYAGCIHKLNAREAAQVEGITVGPDEILGQEELLRLAGRLHVRWGRPVFVTNGPRGCVAAGPEGAQAVSGLHLVRRTDPVGAGDSFLAGVTAALAAGYTLIEAAGFGNFVAGVTVQKIFQTGTASPEEIRAIGSDPDYVYRPELADDPRKACYIEGLDIERIEPLPRPLRITHALFDHDGTLSTLRQGWEQVMERVMVKCILGEAYGVAEETLYARVVKRVREYIDKTTGIQTLVQMQGLIELIKEFHLVAAAGILDEHGYKAIYDRELNAVVSARMERLERGELEVSDFTIKRAPELLRRIHDRGVKLYLASGTDRDDVVREATALRYAGVFEGRIYGAVGDPTRETKRIVVQRILDEIGAGKVERLVAFGDGPVEIRETQKRGGFAVGVASDEVRRFGLSPSKRARLIRAGAHLITPDYSQLEWLLKALGMS